MPNTTPTAQSSRQWQQKRRHRPRLNFPLDEIYGRDTEIECLRSLSQDDNSKTTVIQVCGDAGVGKTRLIQSQQTQFWTPDNGFLFGSGKFVSTNQNKNNSKNSDRNKHKLSPQQPYLAIITALSQICNAWLSLPNGKTHLQNVLQSIQRELGVLQQLLPQLFHNVGIGTTKKPNKDKENSRKNNIYETKSTDFDRIKLALQQLITAASAISDHKIVLFLDDIQWADTSSLQLLQALINNNHASKNTTTTTNNSHTNQGFLLIVAHRQQNERDELSNDDTIKDCLQDFINFVSQMNLSFHKLHVHDFTIKKVNQLLLNVIKNPRYNDESTMPLAMVIHNKTGGNAFFVIQFLQLLQNEDYLYYDLQTHEWTWKDVTEIQQATSILSSNVADVITKSMQDNLPLYVQQVLMVSSCIGAQIPILIVLEYMTRYNQNINDQHLASIDDDDRHSSVTNTATIETITTKAFDVAIDSGILIKQGGISTTIEWSHENLRQAAYSMISKQEQSKWHLRLGKIVCELIPKYPQHKEWMTFMAANQLDQGLDLITHPKMQMDLARLNLDAAIISMSKAAFVPARELLLSAHALFQNNIPQLWMEQYDFALQLFTCISKIESILGNKSEAINAANQVITNSKTLDDKYQVQITLIDIERNSLNFETSLQISLSVLAEYGEIIPRRAGRLRVSWEQWRLQRSYPKFDIEQMPTMQITSNERVWKLSNLITKVATVCALHGQSYLHLARICGIRLQRLACQYGLTCYSIMGLMTSILDAREYEQMDKIEKISNICRKLVDRFSDTLGDHTGLSLSILEGTVMMVRPFHESLDNMIEAHRVAIVTGDLHLSSLCYMMYAFTYLATGLPLDPLRADLDFFRQEAIQFQIGDSVKAMFPLFQQTLQNLIEYNQNDPTMLQGKFVDQELILQEMNGRGESMTFRDICTFRLMLACHYNDLKTAEQLIKQLEPFPPNNLLPSRTHIRNAYTGLAAFAIGHAKNSKEYKNLGQTILKRFKRMTKQGSINAFPVLIMLRAASAHSSIELYNQAIKACGKCGLLHYEALMNEQVARYLIKEADDPLLAEHYVSRAIVLYNDWNAPGKVTQLMNEYPQMIKNKLIAPLQSNNDKSDDNNLIHGHSVSGRQSGVKARPRYDASVAAPTQQFRIEYNDKS